MTEEADFKWPDSPWPTQDWWEVEGSGLGMAPELVRFAAALAQLGGPDSRQNSIAAKLAGIDCSRTQAFRHARSVSVRRLLDRAEQIKTGKRQPLTEEQIDERIDAMVRSPNDTAAAKGIELRERRKDTARARSEAGHVSDPTQTATQIFAEAGLYGAPLVLEMWAEVSGGEVTLAPHFKLFAPFVKRRFPELWSKYRAPLVARAQRFGDGESERGLKEFDAQGDAQEPTDEEFRAAIGATVIAQAKHFEESEAHAA